MNSREPDLATAPSASQSVAPAFLLAILSPVIAEVLMGSTRLSFLFALIPEAMVWGCGALIIRETVRRWRAGWISMAILGIALGVAEECVIQQTSLAPLVGLDPARAYGRFFGVNWVWMLGLLVFESVWVVLVPVQFVESIFPKRQGQPWLRKRGLVVSAVIFIFGSFIAWYLWTQRARPMVYHVPPYHPRVSYIFAGVAAIALLAIVAFVLRRAGAQSNHRERRAPQPWLAGVIAFVFAAPWFLVIGLAYGMRPSLPVWIAILAAAIWAAAACGLFKWWTSSSVWSEMHALAIASGALIASMLMGFAAGNWRRADLTFKIVLDVLALLWMFFLLRKTHARAPGQPQTRESRVA